MCGRRVSLCVVLQDSAKQKAEQVQKKVGEAVDEVGQKVGGVRDAAGDKTSEIAESVQDKFLELLCVDYFVGFKMRDGKRVNIIRVVDFNSLDQPEVESSE